jgi:hypothetical protein
VYETGAIFKGCGRVKIKKISPYLVGWSELPEDMKERDRQAVRKIPEFLANVGLDIQR